MFHRLPEFDATPVVCLSLVWSVCVSAGLRQSLFFLPICPLAGDSVRPVAGTYLGAGGGQTHVLSLATRTHGPQCINRSPSHNVAPVLLQMYSLVSTK